jgi:hypothetical protein
MSTRSISPRRRLYEPEARDAPLLIFEFVRRAGGLVYLHADGFTALGAETLIFLAPALRTSRQVILPTIGPYGRKTDTHKAESRIVPVRKRKFLSPHAKTSSHGAEKVEAKILINGRD